jgi:hypothetical protein
MVKNASDLLVDVSIVFEILIFLIKNLLPHILTVVIVYIMYLVVKFMLTLLRGEYKPNNSKNNSKNNKLDDNRRTANGKEYVSVVSGDKPYNFIKLVWLVIPIICVWLVSKVMGWL